MQRHHPEQLEDEGNRTKPADSKVKTPPFVNRKSEPGRIASTTADVDTSLNQSDYTVEVIVFLIIN